jgi:hypothetical protein
LQGCSSYSNNTPGAWVGPSHEAAQYGVIPSNTDLNTQSSRTPPPLNVTNITVAMPTPSDPATPGLDFKTWGFSRPQPITPSSRPEANHPKQSSSRPEHAAYTRHPDRSNGRPHRPLRSGGTPAFRFCLFLPLPVLAVVCSCRCLFLPLSVLAVVCSCRCLFLPLSVLAVVCSCGCLFLPGALGASHLGTWESTDLGSPVLLFLDIC